MKLDLLVKKYSWEGGEREVWGKSKKCTRKLREVKPQYLMVEFMCPSPL